MRASLRTMLAALSALVLVALVVAASAAAATTYRLAGVEFAATSSTGSFVGLVIGQPGTTWVATIAHEPLAKAPGSVTTILPGGGFAFYAGSTQVAGGAIAGGQLVAGPVFGFRACIQQFRVAGSLVPAGSFGGTLTHYGTRDATGSCNASFATFTGAVSLP